MANCAGASSFETMIAEARVESRAGRYLRFTRKVRSPARASSMPATPRISSWASPSSSQPSSFATSPSFIAVHLVFSSWQMYNSGASGHRGPGWDVGETLLRKQFGLRGGEVAGNLRPATGGADYTENLNFFQGRAGDVDAQIIAVEVGRGN